MRAIMLAAGVGARLGGGDDHPPKALLEFGGKSLLRRHIEILRHAGIGELAVVTGYRADLIEAEIARAGGTGFARTILNPDYREGSIVSLWAARHALVEGGDILLMDADVLYDRRMIDRLMTTSHENCFLLDRDFEPGDEPVKVCVRGGSIVDFEKRVEGEHDLRGESVGFFRFSPEIAARLAAAAEADAASDGASGRRQRMYEQAIREILLDSPASAFGYEDVTGVPWIEIDFPEDIERARIDILPRLRETVS
jgi:choline kinase